MTKHIVVGISGASGIIYGVRLLEVLKELGQKTYVTMTDTAKEILKLETNYNISDIEALSYKYYEISDMKAPFASGSFIHNGMCIVPCSMNTATEISYGFSHNLLLRGAAVTLKEGRKLIIVPRETPLSSVQLKNLLRLSRMGVTILPAMPAFYHKPKDVVDIVDFIVGKILDNLGIPHNIYKRWGHNP